MTSKQISYDNGPIFGALYAGIGLCVGAALGFLGSSLLTDFAVLGWVVSINLIVALVLVIGHQLLERAIGPKDEGAARKPPKRRAVAVLVGALLGFCISALSADYFMGLL